MSINSHPIGTSHYADGQIPNQAHPTAPGNKESEKIYLQPAVEVQQVAKGVEIKNKPQKSLCQRIAEEKSKPAINEWFAKNKGIIGWIGIGYLALRILTRRR